MRWSDYILKGGDEFDNFWSDYLLNRSKNVLFIHGLGFDPRTNIIFKKIYGIPGNGKRSSIILTYHKTSNQDFKQSSRVKNNKKEIDEFLQINKTIDSKFHKIVLRSEENKSIAGRNAGKVIRSFQDINNYSDIIVDVSAIPRSIFFPLISKILSLIDENISRKLINLHIVVTENSKLDANIIPKGIAEEANMIHGFGGFNTESTKEKESIWIPILGEGKNEELDKIRHYVNPSETSPILPFPSINLRRGDNLITEYNKLFFATLNIDSRNILYADEQNPFQLYRQIINTAQRYQESFKLLNGCKIYISPLSSKLLSIGTLLSVYELKKKNYQIGISLIETFDQKLKDSEDTIQNLQDKNQCFEIWLTGDPYEN